MGILEKYSIKKVKNKQIAGALILEPIYNAHALHVCRKKPEDESMVVISRKSGKIEASLITGIPEVYVVPGYWLSASNYESAEILIKTLDCNAEISINYPIWAEEIIKGHFGDIETSYDNIYVYAKKYMEGDSSNLAMRLTEDIYNSCKIPKELKGLVCANDLKLESKFFCILENNTVCSIGEHYVDSGSVSAISQIFTVPQFRGKGYAAEVIKELAREILSENKMPIYLLSESNIASKRACEKAGFVLCARIGFAEREN
ncbi:GNAT family N-acetyltransferase [Clostridium hydrogenum]|uniref:GNAT family N-acetyltransferase n=1 Tax=Clostridium hydrogenum TaxID=2855764 RepID=UPI001F1774C4|nr:GNAT family N-acetyltransferase [Clostridium hydrogenum]